MLRSLATGLDREFNAEEVWAGLESVFLTCQPEGGMPNAAAAFEFLSFIADCIGQYAEHIGAAEELTDVLERIRFTALTAFVAALGAELGVEKDRWRRSGKPRR